MSFWSTHFDSMALKTMLRQLISKWGVMSIELQKAYVSDMGVLNEKEEVEYVDNIKEEVKEEVEADANTGEVLEIEKPKAKAKKVVKEEVKEETQTDTFVDDPY